jgi:hypothetical protein
MTLSKVEKIITKNGPIKKVTDQDVKSGLETYNAIRTALGATGKITSPASFGTYSEGNAKLAKDGKVYIGGITYAPANMVVKFWNEASTSLKESIAKSVDVSVSDISSLLKNFTICPRSTKGCREACLIVSSGHMGLQRKAAENQGKPWYEGVIVRAQIARTLNLVLNPVGTVALMNECIATVQKKAETLSAEPRWRLAIADDIRWEMVAPVLITSCRSKKVKMYGYTKWDVVDRVAPQNVTLVRSASERTSDKDIVDIVSSRNNVAVVFDVNRKDAFPKTWNGMKIVDGDKSDDRSADPKGVIVGLRAKGDAVGSTSKFVRSI